MYISDTNKSVHNFEWLFNLTNSTGGDPPPQSLFNITTINLLLNASVGIVDIIENPNLTSPMNLSNYTNVTKVLGFETNEQSYLLYLWMTYCRKYTFARAMDTNDPSVILAANIGQ
jgi:hypothetical protein